MVDQFGKSVSYLVDAYVRRVVESTTPAAETRALTSEEAGVYTAKLLSDALNVPIKNIIFRYLVDNKSFVDSLYSTKRVVDKHLRISIAVLRDILAWHDIA